jgi:hypothetical protein
VYLLFKSIILITINSCSAVVMQCLCTVPSVLYNTHILIQLLHKSTPYSETTLIKHHSWNERSVVFLEKFPCRCFKTSHMKEYFLKSPSADYISPEDCYALKQGSEIVKASHSIQIRNKQPVVGAIKITRRNDSRQFQTCAEFLAIHSQML